MILFQVFIFTFEQGQKMKIETTAILYIQSWKSYWISIYIVLLSIPMEFPVRLRLHHTHHHSQHTRSGNLQSTERDQCRQVRLFDTWTSHGTLFYDICSQTIKAVLVSETSFLVFFNVCDKIEMANNYDIFAF